MTGERTKAIQLTMDTLYDDTVVYCSRPSYISNAWLQPDEHQSNFLTGRELLIAHMPVIVHEASVTHHLHTLFRHVNQSVPETLYTFRDQSSYEMTLQRLTQVEGKKIYFQYVHDADIVRDEDYALNKQMFKDLNNKTFIAQWTRGAYLPKREVVHIDALETALRSWSFPFVLKPGDELPTAGGYGVMICYHASDLTRALRRIYAAREETVNIIIEQKIEAVHNYCVQFAYSETQGIQYLGAASQLTDDYGFYNGNENVTCIDEAVIQAGFTIMESAVEQGFTGIAGFDLLQDVHGDIYAIDLNYRQNGSTSMLMLKNELQEGYHKFYSYIARGDNAHFFKTIESYVLQGVLYPLSYYDGEWYQETHVDSRFAGIWHARDKATVEELEASFLNALEQGE